MTASREAAARLLAVADLLQRPSGLPPISACAEQAAALFRPGGGEKRPPALELDALRGWLKQICVGPQAQDLSQQPARSFDLAPVVLWNGTDPAARFPGLLDHLLHRAPTRPRLLTALIEAWLCDFDAEAPGLREAAVAIRQMLRHATHPRFRFWAAAEERFGLFDADHGPERMAKALMTTDDVDGVLAAIGMNDPLRSGGKYLREVITRFLTMLPAGLSEANAPAAWIRATHVLLNPDDGSSPLRPATGKSRFHDIAMNGLVARACLMPWLVGTASVDAPQEHVKTFLLSNLKDPRLYPGSWSEAGEPITRLMQSWLAAATLEAFFTLIGEVTDDEQWNFRRAFWRACLKKAPNTEVWVILGSDLVPRARSVKLLTGGFGYHTIAGRSNQAALLIRIGHLALLEWSHIGALKAFEAGSRTSPSFYETKRDFYSYDKINFPSLQFPDHPATGKGGARDEKGLRHRKPERGLWQGCAAALLERRLGFELKWQDYMNP